MATVSHASAGILADKHADKRAEIIEACDGDDWTTQDTVIDILRDEEEHLRQFERYLREFE